MATLALAGTAIVSCTAYDSGNSLDSSSVARVNVVETSSLPIQRKRELKTPQPADQLAVKKLPQIRVVTGLASYYGPGFHGKKTASGVPFDKNKLVAAHPTLPFGTQVRVVNLENGKSVAVRIVDRGPHERRQRAGVIIDLSEGAGEQLDMLHAGLVKVKVETKSVQL